MDASSLQTTVSAGIPSSTVVTTTSNVVFSSTGGLNVATSLAEAIIINALDGSGSVVSTSSNSVRIAPGRFFPPDSNSVYTFFKNEPIADISFTAPFAMVPPVTTLSLPVGLSFVSNTPSNYFLSGTPLLEYPSCNYTVLGRDLATGTKVITTVVNIGVRPERVQLDVSGTTLKNNMTVGTAIDSTFVTARYPSQATSNLQYTWSDLPSGLFFSDCNGIPQTTGFRPADASATIVLQGTPNLTAASNFAALGISSNTITLTAKRVSLPAISNTTNFTFSFDETVLFDTPFIQTFYVGVPISSSTTSNSYRARTYFALTDVSITNITAASLPAGVSLTFNSNDQRAYLSGTPTTASASSYTITAVNSNLVTRDLVSPITVANDVITFDPLVTAATDLCVNFILSRPVTNVKDGFYPGSILFRATAASGCNVTFSAPALSGTGLTLSNVGNNTVQLVGIPEVVQSLSNLSIIASAVGTPATASRDISFAILNDQFTFTTSPSSATLIQNVEMTPVQISATTLSERNVIGYTATSVPTGLSISTTGKISGTPTLATPTSGNITWTATTGYASSSGDVSFNLTPDSALIVAPQNRYIFNAGDFVSIPIEGSTYSGISVSNYVTDLSATFGLTIGSNSGILSGTLISGEPPGPFYPTSQQNFTIDASAAALSAQLDATFAPENVPFEASFVVFGAGGNSQIVRSTNDYSDWSNFLQPGGSPSSFKSRHLGDYSNYIIFTTTQQNRSINIYSNGNFFSNGLNQEFGFLDPTDGTVKDLLSPLPVSVDISGNGPVVYAGVNTYKPTIEYRLLYESTDLGFTWTPISTIGSNTPPFTLGDRSKGCNTTNAYTQGFALGVKDGVYLAGGLDWGNSRQKALWRTLNPLQGWVEPTVNDAPVEISAFSLDEANNWMMTGSDTFRTIDLDPLSITPPALANATIWNSVDNGGNWEPMMGAFNLIAYSISYGSGVWIATGIDNVGGSDYRQNIKYFVSGDSQWQQLDLSGSSLNLFPNISGPPFVKTPPLDIGPVTFDGSNWNILARVKPATLGPSIPTLFQHPAGSNLSSGWTAIEAPDLGALSTITGAFMEGLTPSAFYKDFPSEPTQVAIIFSNAGTGTPPVVTSPTNTSFTFYEYVPIAPIQLSGTGTGIVYFFVTSSDLPQGLTFDRVTNTISGTPMRIGTFFVNILVKDDAGVRGLGLTLNVLKPFVEKQQSSAGAYTSYLRQYTVVNAAQNAINTHVLPEPTTLGSFMAPQPQDVTLATVDPKCFSSNKCV
jgi:hypothetical protein